MKYERSEIGALGDRRRLFHSPTMVIDLPKLGRYRSKRLGILKVRRKNIAMGLVDHAA